MVESIKGNVVVWGGYGRPNSVIHIYNVNERTWKDVEASGEIHQSTRYPASVAVDNLIFIFGGKNALARRSNRLSSLSLSGRFRRMKVKGSQPLPRSRAVGWSHDGHLFFGFGINYDGSGRDADTEYLEGGEWSRGKGKGETNEILKFDRKRKSFSLLITTGPKPSPRYDMGAAKLGSKVFIHGGYEYHKPKKFDDFYSLHMTTKQWTRLTIIRPFSPLMQHSLSVASPKQLVLLGGGVWSPRQTSNKVMIYNTETDAWTEDQRLPKDLCGDEGGLWDHKAVEIRKGNRVAKIICVGGRVHEYGEVDSRKLLELDVSMET